MQKVPYMDKCKLTYIYVNQQKHCVKVVEVLTVIKIIIIINEVKWQTLVYSVPVMRSLGTRQIDRVCVI